MIQILKKLVLTTLFAVFATQASAMFIQADWLDPTKPGVGTNRYSYSFNDPINLRDPGGNDIDDDPRDHSTNSEDYDTARGQEGQAVDEARERHRLEGEIERAAEDLFGRPFDELNSIQKAAASAVAAAQNGLLGPQAHAITNTPPAGTGPVPQRGLAGSLSQATKTIPNPKSSTLWSGTKSKTPAQNALSHYQKHKSEFPEYQNATQYAKGAQAFVNSPPKGTQSVPRKKTGDTMHYNPNTNTFAVSTPTGVPRTMFRPSSGPSYWADQLQKWK